MHLVHMYGVPDSSDMWVLAYRKAEPLLARALELDDSLGEAYVLRADLKTIRGTSQVLKRTSARGWRSAQRRPWPRALRELPGAEGRIDEALVAVDRARVVDPLYPRSHYFKGVLLLLHGRGSLEEAEALFLQALSVAPDFHPALSKLGTIRGFFPAALQKRWITRNARSPSTLVPPGRALSSAFLYLDLDDPDGARHVIAELADPPPETWVPICLYENNLEGAHRILRGVGLNDIALDQLHTYVLHAVRDRALASGELGGAREAMQAVAEKWDPTVSAASAEGLDKALAARGGLNYPGQFLRRRSGGSRSASSAVRRPLRALP